MTETKETDHASTTLALMSCERHEWSLSPQLEVFKALVGCFGLFQVGFQGIARVSCSPYQHLNFKK